MTPPPTPQHTLSRRLDEINLFNDQYVLAVVGNKRDRPEATRTVSEREGRALASEYGAHFVESSALTGENVQELFHHISGGILDNFRVRQCVSARVRVCVCFSDGDRIGDVITLDTRSRWWRRSK